MTISHAGRYVHTPAAAIPRCHCSSVVECASGDLLCAFYGGSGESHSDEAHWFARLPAGADAWGPVTVLQKTPGHASGNIRLFRVEDDVVAIYAVNYGDWCHGGSRLFSIRSGDCGQSWSTPSRIDVGYPVLGKNKAIALESGALLLPAHRESPRGEAYPPMCWLLSTDGGHTWARHGAVESPDVTQIHQAAAALRSDGSVLVLSRTDGQRIYRFVIDRDGVGFPEQAEAMALPNNNSGIDVQQLADGRHVLVYNHASDRRRTPLCVALSEDDGETWARRIMLEDAEGEFSYPAITQATDGTVHITYTYLRTHIKHVALSPREMD